MKSKVLLGLLVFFSLLVLIFGAVGVSPARAAVYTVTYDGNGNTGGIVPTDSNTYVTGDVVTVRGAGTLTRTGYTFIGWNTAANGSGTSYYVDATFTMGSSNVTLYAKWTTSTTYSVTYKGNGNTGGTAPVDSNRYLNGSTLIVRGPSTLVKTGYAFNGWNTRANGTGTNYNPGNTLTIRSNVTLYAKWAPTYTVDYSGNGNTGGTAPTDNNHYVSGATVTVLDSGTLVKTGYAFNGWNTKSNGSGSSYDAGATFTMGSTNVTLYAKWVPTYTVTYDGNGNTAGATPTDSNHYLNGETGIVLGPGTLVKTGYAFGGWNTKSDGSGTSYSADGTFTIGSANIILYAQWKPTYTVIYDGNGNTGGAAPTDSNRYINGETVVVVGSDTLVKAGYTFVGWNTQANGSGINYYAGATFAMGSANVTLYAKWTLAPTYTVAYDGNDNTDGTPPIDTNNYVSEATVTVRSAGTLVKTGYAFAGWNTQANGLGTSYNPGDDFEMGSANVTLYAQWVPAYTVTYDGNGNTGGEPPIDNHTYRTGDTVIVRDAGTLVKDDHTFVGWNTQADGLDTPYNPGEPFTMDAANVILYAQWVPIYTVTYDGNGNTGGEPPIDNHPYRPGDTVIVRGSGALVKDGYTFAGWNTQAEINTHYDPGDTFPMPAADVTLYAQWTVIDYTVTYEGNGNTSGEPPIDPNNPYHIGDLVTVLGSGALIKTGYYFDRWNTQDDGLGTPYDPGDTFPMPAADVTLYAKWVAIDYTVTYDGNGHTGGEPPIDPNTYYIGEPVTVLGPGALVKDGYTFEAWNTQADGHGTSYAPPPPDSTFDMDAANVTLYAQWKPIDYTVIYDGNGNTSGEPPIDPNNPYHIGDLVTVLGSGALVKTGYYFDRWNTQDDGLGTPYDPGDTFPMPAADVTLYAQWKPIDYTVIYDGNGNTSGEPPDPNHCHIGDPVTVPNPGTLVKTGYAFNGWNTQAGGGGTPYNPNDILMCAGNVTLYAQWVVVGVPTLISPRNNSNITEMTAIFNRPTFKWSKLTSATQYKIELYKIGAPKALFARELSPCTASACTFLSPITLTYAKYRWHVRAKINGTWRPYSAYFTFTISPDFNSQFKTNAIGWTPVRGGWNIGGGFYSTIGTKVNYLSSIKRTSQYRYTNIDYKVRMKRTECLECANLVIIRGTPVLVSTDLWKSGYVFEYKNARKFSVWKCVDIGNSSSCTAIKDWTSSGAIAQRGWNTLRVTASGQTLTFYINDKWVWDNKDKKDALPLTNGQVGIGMFLKSTPPSLSDKLQIDWAILTVLP